jgi:hypothetical protein
MKKLFLLLLGMILLSYFAQGELYLWNTVSKDYANDLVKYHAFYTFEDTSASGIGKSREIPIDFLVTTENLPFSVGGVVNIDWCNFTLVHYKSVYDNDGNLINTSKETESRYYTSGVNSETITINAKARDRIIADMSCHYDDGDYLYYENVLGGRFTTFTGSYECSGCTEFTLEELTNQINNLENISNQEIQIYENVQKVVDYDFQVWLVLSWVVKIAFIFIAIFLIISSIRYFYNFVTEMGRT